MGMKESAEALRKWFTDHKWQFSEDTLDDVVVFKRKGRAVAFSLARQGAAKALRRRG